MRFRFSVAKKGFHVSSLIGERDIFRNLISGVECSDRCHADPGICRKYLLVLGRISEIFRVRGVSRGRGKFPKSARGRVAISGKFCIQPFSHPSKIGVGHLKFWPGRLKFSDISINSMMILCTLRVFYMRSNIHYPSFLFERELSATRMVLDRVANCRNQSASFRIDRYQRIKLNYLSSVSAEDWSDDGGISFQCCLPHWWLWRRLRVHRIYLQRFS